VQLFFERPAAVRGLSLVRPECAQLALLGQDALHSSWPDRPRQLVLEIARARVESDPLELAAFVAPQPAQEMSLFPDVIETGEWDVAIPLEQAWQIPVAAHRDDGDAIGFEVAATATGKRLDSLLVAGALNEHYCARLHCCIRSGRPQAAALPWAGVREYTLRFGHWRRVELVSDTPMERNWPRRTAVVSDTSAVAWASDAEMPSEPSLARRPAATREAV
jgi:hypothetical protein